MIESRWIPGAAVVAGLASGREAGLRVRRIVGLVEVREVAANTSRRRSRKLPAGVARAAIEIGVCPDQGESGELQVIELRAHPIVHRVALLAGGGQIQRNVIDAERLGAREISLVAREAHGRQSLELSHCRTPVTRIAIHSGVRAHQREAVQVLIDLLDRNMPSLHGVALLTIGAHLALVNVGVTIRTAHANIREDRLGMALRAADALVHPAQRILRGVVVEFGNGPDRFPAAKRVAILAGNAQASMRASGIRRRLRLSACQLPARKNRQRDHKMQKNCRSQGCPNLLTKRISTRETEAYVC